MAEEKIYYYSTDKIKLCGLLSKVNDSNKIIILCHGIRGNKDERNSFVNLTKILQNYNYNSFRFDFRAHGESTGNDYEMTISKEIEDLESTIHMLMQKGFTSFILLGASFGAGIISLLNYSKYTNIKGLICWYGALDYKFITDDSFFSEKNKKIAEEKGYYSSISKSSGKEFKIGLQLFEEVNRTTPYKNLLDIEIPILFVHGNKDKMVPVELSKKVNSMCKNSKFELIENGDHTFNNSEQALNSAIEKTLDFIKKVFKRGEI